MGYWLAGEEAAQVKTWVKRFDPAYWTVDFPRPMMAAVTTSAPDALRVDAVFYRRDDLAGLIWASEDQVSHPLLKLETARDYQRCRLRFRWRSSGIKPLDAVNGPTLTIEGSDEAGQPRSWYVRLWNYAAGTPEDAVVSLDFGNLREGFAAGGAPVFTGNVDRMFVSLVPDAYVGTAAALDAPQEAFVTLSELVCSGSGSVLEVGDVVVPPHTLGIATGYDDCYNLTPARLVRTISRLGYRGAVNHYVGMSHYYWLERVGERYLASLAGGALNAATAAWHRDFAARLAAAGLGLITSLSYELFDANCPDEWKQRAADGSPALTGWMPPSTLLSPAQPQAMAYLQAVARAFVQLTVEAGQVPRFQIGEPWWWVQPGGAICLYDAGAQARLGSAGVPIADVDGPLNAAQLALLDRAGALLAESTGALFAAVRGDHPTCERLLLVYLPGSVGERGRANCPKGWARPACDVLQLEDYEWVTSGNDGASRAAIAQTVAKLDYPASAQHYLSGFVLKPEERAQWREIAEAVERARRRGVIKTYVWALPQVMRDGWTWFDEGDEVDAFDNVAFPIAIGRDARVSPRFSTAVVTSAGGHEQRNADWAQARLRFDAGPGVRSEADVAALLGFFRARRGMAKAFRFRDPTDHSSNGMTETPTAIDQLLGSGDGVRTRFPLVKRYGADEDAEVRRVTRPVAASVRVSVEGVERLRGWSLDGGSVLFENPPAAGAAVRAGFLFDVPVRFGEDKLDIGAGLNGASEVGEVPLVEVRE